MVLSLIFVGTGLHIWFNLKHFINRQCIYYISSFMVFFHENLAKSRNSKTLGIASGGL